MVKKSFFYLTKVLLSNSKRAFISSIVSCIIKYKKFKSEESVIIFSEARGGSTWLLEVLLNIPNSIANWEPFQVGKGVVPTSFHWNEYPYLPPSNSDKQYVVFFDKVLTFKLNNRWTNIYCTISRTLTSKVVITKFVRTNLMLPWLLKNFELRRKPILLLRHPISVIMSQSKAFGKFQYTVPECAFNERFVQNFEFISSLETELEKRIAVWCINNVAVINDMHVRKQCIIVYYENLLTNSEFEVKRIFNELSFYSDKLINRSLQRIHKPSRTDFKKDLKENVRDQIEKAFSELDAETSIRVQKVFDYYGLKDYTAFSPYPIIS